MTREEAIKRIKIHMHIHRMAEDRAVYITEALNMAIEALEAQRWLSVSEEPKTSGYYNCACYDGVTNRVTTLKWSNGWMLSGRRAYWKVLAWMPLPKYTEEES